MIVVPTTNSLPPPRDHIAIEARNLTKTFGTFTAVNNVSFRVPRGTVLGVLGPNGAGKTTTVRMMTTLLTPTSGQAFVAGHNVADNPAAVRQCMGLTAQAATVDELLTGAENLRLIGRLYGLSAAAARSRAAQLLAAFSLDDASDRIAKKYSGGMRRRLDLAASLVASPEVLFLDEPTTGVDPRSRQELWDVLRELVRGGTTVLLTTQYLDEADQLADNIIIIDHGRIVAEGTPLHLKDTLGAASLVITVSRAEDIPAAERIVAERVPDVHVDPGARRLTAPSEGVSALATIASAFSNAGIDLDDIGLQRPSLDDVFLTLTGKPLDTTDIAEEP